MLGRTRYREAGDFNGVGVINSVPGSPGAPSGPTPGKVVLASRVIPAGATAYIDLFSANVIDLANADQVYFQIVRNGVPIQSGAERIPGVQFQYQPQISINAYLPAGTVEIWAFNISGMNTAIEPSAIAVVAIQCQAWWSGRLLSERGGIS